MECEGHDSEGKTYSSTKEMWEEEIGGEAAEAQHRTKEWYTKGVGYWELSAKESWMVLELELADCWLYCLGYSLFMKVEASVDGVLGGYGHVNGRDVKDSNEFLIDILGERSTQNGHLVALDCGAGVGRVTKNLLLKHFHEVDLVEPVSHFLESAREKMKVGSQSKSVANHAVNFYCIPLQEFTPDEGRYDVIWIQWCIGHLTDADFVAFFNRAKVGLKPEGFFVLKENVARDGFVLDKEDHSVTRSDSYFRELFKQAGLYIYKTKAQKGFPQELYPVKMYALTTEPPAIVQDVSHERRSKRRTKKSPIM